MKHAPDRTRWTVALALLAAASAAHAQAPAFLVKDILIEPEPRVFGGGVSEPLGDVVLFERELPTTGRERWRTDGSAEGTQLVRDIRPGSEDGLDARGSVVIGNVRLFYANDGEHGYELWRTDGTEAGTQLVRDIAPGPGTSNQYQFYHAVVGDTLYFLADDGVNGRQIWRSDGTTDGTSLVTVLPAGTAANPFALTVVGEHMYFRAFQQETGDELWRTDGTQEGTELVKDIYPGPGSSSIANLFAAYGALYFVADDGLGFGIEPWKSEGTAATTARVADLVPGPGSSSLFSIGSVGNTFFLTRGGTGNLWKTDGTAAGTVLVETLSSGQPGAYGSIGSFREVNGVGIFRAQKGYSTELWRTDGTAEGTFLLRPSICVEAPLVVGSIAYFCGFDSESGFELWTTDGTVDGTQLFADIFEGPESSTPQRFAAANGLLFFQANDGVTGFEPWRSDGTSLGTALIADLGVGLYFLRNSTIDPAYTTAIDLDGTLILAANDGTSGVEPWKSDGTDAGTTRIADIVPGEGYSGPGDFVRVGDRVFFRAYDAVVGPEIWTTDGDTVTRVGDFTPADPGVCDPWDLCAISEPLPLAAVGDLLMVTIDDGIHSGELWRSDGTEAGTMLIRDVFPGPRPSPGAPHEHVAIGDTFFFTADDGEHGLELWRTDGIEANTLRLTDFAPPDEAMPIRPARFGANLWFVARSATVDGLWHTQGGTLGDVVPLRTFDRIESALVAVGDLLYFFATDAIDGEGLWKTDGALTGTVRVKDIVPGVDSLSVNVSSLIGAGDLVYFTVDVPATGRELWRSDGTETGTIPIPEIWPGPKSSNPTSLTAIGGALVFAADDGSGREPWVTDGSAAGTRRIADVANPGGSDPTSFVASGDLVYFSALSDAAGAALFAVPRSIIEPDLSCDVAMSQSSYVDGEPVVITSLRFANQKSSPVTTRLRLQLTLPIGPGIVADAIDLGADGSFAIPANFDKQLGPVTMFTLGPQIPIRGELEWRCAFEDPITGAVISERRASFELQ